MYGRCGFGLVFWNTRCNTNTTLAQRWQRVGLVFRHVFQCTRQESFPSYLWFVNKDHIRDESEHECLNIYSKWELEKLGQDEFEVLNKEICVCVFSRQDVMSKTYLLFGANITCPAWRGRVGKAFLSSLFVNNKTMGITLS